MGHPQLAHPLAHKPIPNLTTYKRQPPPAMRSPQPPLLCAAPSHPLMCIVAGQTWPPGPPPDLLLPSTPSGSLSTVLPTSWQVQCTIQNMIPCKLKRD
jgi:hypothetical protein